MRTGGRTPALSSRGSTCCRPSSPPSLTHELLRAGDRVIVAVSGGPDSMALLHVLWELRARLGLTLEVAAVDHGLRADAAREVQLVRERAEALGLPFSAVSVDVAAERRRRRGASLQDAARDARLAGARRAGQRARGRPGGAGASGGRPGRDRALSDHPRHRRRAAWRAFRTGATSSCARCWTSRAPQILRYLRRRSIPFVEDPSNADPRFARARIRHRILPALAQENPRVARGAACARRRRARRRRRRPRTPRTMALSRRAAATVARLASRGGTASIDVAGRRRVEVSYGRIRVHDRGNGGAVRQPAPKPAPIVIDRPGTYRWSDAGAVEVRELAVGRSKKESSSPRRVRRRSAGLAARHAGAEARGPDAAARRPWRPQAFATS